MLRRMKLIVCFCVLLCALDNKADDNQVSLTKLGTKTGPTLKFFYCYSCGYRKVFEEYVSILQQKYPELQINGENYIPSHNKMLIAKLLNNYYSLMFCWSKLETGRIPQPLELFQIIDNHLNMQYADVDME
ncbi:SelT-like protein [Melipona quadrifasciata]|uniref:SelT-like protein n=1 Tax=Melipona quadrifasciata TaxID=166423 RepID=A0A0M8ZU19_9HYME|nr:SelT-like protein [Melipona quadrifasciata]